MKKNVKCCVHDYKGNSCPNNPTRVVYDESGDQFFLCDSCCVGFLHRKRSFIPTSIFVGTDGMTVRIGNSRDGVTLCCGTIHSFLNLEAEYCLCGNTKQLDFSEFSERVKK